MKKKWLKVVSVIVATAMLAVMTTSAYAQQKEVLVIYENFGGHNPSVSGITPDKWFSMNPGLNNIAKTSATGAGNGNGIRLNNEDQGEGQANAIGPNGVGAMPMMAGSNMPFIIKQIADTLISWGEGPAMAAAGIVLDTAGFGTVGAGNSFTHPVSARNGYTGYVAGRGNAGMSFKLRGATVYPELYAAACYDTVLTPGGHYTMNVDPLARDARPWLNSYVIPDNGKQKFSGKPDQKGYIAMMSPWNGTVGGNLNAIASAGNLDYAAMVTIPGTADSGAYLTNISKAEFYWSGSRGANFNHLIVFVDYLNAAGTAVVSTDTVNGISMNYAMVTLTVPVKNANNNKVQFRLRNSYENRLAPYTYKAVVAGSLAGDTWVDLPYNTTAITNAAIANPGVMIYSVKMYGMMSGAYNVTCAECTPANGELEGENIKVTAPATKGGKAFAGWRASGYDDLSYVTNPATIPAKEGMVVTPLYVDDQAEMLVVNEDFTDWAPERVLQTGLENAEAGLVSYANYGAAFTAGSDTYGRVNKTVRVPLRNEAYKTTYSKDSVDIKLYLCNVAPESPIRSYKAPGYATTYGFIGFSATAAENKGYLEVDSLAGLSRVAVEASSYQASGNNGIGAISVFANNVLKQTVFPLFPYNTTKDNITLDGSKVNLQIGYGHYTRHPLTEIRYAATATTPILPDTIMKKDVHGNDSIIWGANIKGLKGSAAPANGSVKIGEKRPAAYSALHSLQVYAQLPIVVPASSYRQLTIEASTGGLVGVSPRATNQTSHYEVGTVLNLTARATAGYSFAGWIIDGDNANPVATNPLQITLNANVTVKAVFDQSAIINIVSLKGSIIHNTEGLQKLSADGKTLTYANNANVMLVAKPMYAWKLSATTPWDVDTSVYVPVTVSNDTIRLTGVNGNITVTANYDTISTRANLTLDFPRAANTSTVASDPVLNFINSGSGLAAQVATGATVKLTVTPAAGYKFGKWTGANKPQDSTLNVNTLTMDANKTVKWTVVGNVSQLNDLSLGSVTLTPAFNPATFTYSAAVAKEVENVTITAQKMYTYQTLRGDGQKTLSTGANAFKVVVKDEVGDSSTYALTVTRAAQSNIAKLSALGVTGATLKPAFNSATLNYTTTVSANTAIITATASNDGTVSGAGEKTLTAGENTFSVVVTSEDGAKTTTYTIKITHTATGIATESSLVSLYPNPVADMLTIENDNMRAGAEINVYNLSGGTLVATYTATGAKTIVNVSQLAAGTYVVKVGKYSARFVKK